MNDKKNTALKSLGINELFKTMNFSDTFYSCDIALSWLDRHNKKFYGFVDGQYLKEEKLHKDLQTTLRSLFVFDYFSTEALCQVFTPVDTSLLKWTAGNSTKGFKAWSDVSPIEKSKVLNKIAENIEKNHELFSVIEALFSGKHLYKAKREITDLIESFKYYASYVLKFDKMMPGTWHPIGPVCVIPDEYNNPSLTLNFRICSLLASGNSVLLLPHAHCSLSAFILAELCSNQGLPDGVLNVIPIHPKKFKNPEELPILSKLIFTGSFERSILYSKLSAQANMQCEVLIPKRPVVIVYENADFHSAANGVLEAFFNHDTRSTSGGCKVLIQENIYDKFLKVLAERFRKMKFGSNFSQTDFSSIVTVEQEKKLMLLKEKAVMFCGKFVSQSNGNFYYRKMDPLLFSSIQTNCKLVQEELGGPVIVTVPFRTVKESISMFNCENKGSSVSIWTEVLRIALEVSQKLKSGVIWVNSENLMDPRFPFSGVYLSGNSLEGGKDAIFSHLSIINENFDVNQENNIVFYKKDSDEAPLSEKGNDASESDVLTAVTKASSAQLNWEALPDTQRRNFFTGITEKLNKNKKDYIVQYQNVIGLLAEDCEKDFDTILNILYYWSMQNDKYNEPMKQVTSDVMVIQNRDPLGVIGIQCPDENPLLSFISLVVPAVMYGNAVVAITNMKYKQLISTVSEAFTAAKLPSGVLNVVYGDASVLVRALRKNTDVNAVWYTDVPRENIFSHSNPFQKLFDCKGIWYHLTEANSLKYTLESTYSKSIFLPHGDIFAN